MPSTIILGGFGHIGRGNYSRIVSVVVVVIIAPDRDNQPGSLAIPARLV